MISLGVSTKVTAGGLIYPFTSYISPSGVTPSLVLDFENNKYGTDSSGTLSSVALSEIVTLNDGTVDSTGLLVNTGTAPTVALADFNFNASAGTIVRHLELSSLGVDRYSFSLHDGTTGERLAGLITSADRYQMMLTVDGGATQAVLQSANLVTTGTTKAASCYTANDFAASLNGNTVLTDTAGTLPTVTTFTLGAGHANNALLNGHIRRLVYYASRLPDSDLTSLST